MNIRKTINKLQFALIAKGYIYKILQRPVEPHDYRLQNHTETAVPQEKWDEVRDEQMEKETDATKGGL